jgi:hypothetical protein
LPAPEIPSNLCPRTPLTAVGGGALRHIGPPSIVDPQLNLIAKKQFLQTGPSECLPAFAAENLLPLLNDFVYQQIELPLFSLLQSVVKLPYKSRTLPTAS